MSNTSKWVSVAKAAEYYAVTDGTIRKWVDSGTVTSRRTPTNQRQIKIDPTVPSTPQRTNYLYVRVSSYKQKDDLKRQTTFLSEQYPDHQIISDIGSGINLKRHGLLSLLEQVQTDSVGEIVVASKDRLCRFGFDLIEWLCVSHGSKIVVLEQHDQTPEEELAAELLDIIQVFCCKRNGRRRYRANIEDASQS